jgi:hypothetical protein
MCQKTKWGDTKCFKSKAEALDYRKNVHIDERIPPGYVPRDKRKDRSDDDSGESLRESNDESGTSSASANRSIRSCGQNNALLSQSTLPISTSIVNPIGTNTNGGQWALWKLAAKEEYRSLQENGTWKLVYQPKDRKVLQGKGSICDQGRYATRRNRFLRNLRVSRQTHKLQSHIRHCSSTRLGTGTNGCQTAFLYVYIDTRYMEQPQGCNDGSGRVCLLQKALYGLKQAPRIWNGLIVAVYVDDLLIVGPDMTEINRLKKGRSDKFRIEDLGPCSYYLGMKVTRDRPNRTIKLSQKGYLKKVLRILACRTAMRSTIRQ